MLQGRLRKGNELSPHGRSRESILIETFSAQMERDVCGGKGHVSSARI